MAAASDLKFAMDELVGAFGKARPDIGVSVSYGSSGNFLSQISNGAPFDLFFSADIEYPRRLAEAGLAPKGSEFLYAVGRIVVWVPAASSIPIERGLRALTAPEVDLVAVWGDDWRHALEARPRSEIVLFVNSIHEPGLSRWAEAVAAGIARYEADGPPNPEPH